MEPYTASRLYSRLSEFIFKCKKNDVDFNIATLLAAKINEFPDVNISEIAYLANTTPASVSRFCKKIGYASFFDLRNDANQFYADPLMDNITKQSSTEAQIDSILNHLKTMDETITKQFDIEQLKNIAAECDKTKSIAIISNTYYISAAHFFREVFSLQGYKVVQINREASTDILEHILADYDVVFLISLTGEWVIQNKELFKESANTVKVLLTQSTAQAVLPKFDHLVSFSAFDFMFSSAYYSHRIMMLWIALLGTFIKNKD